VIYRSTLQPTGVACNNLSVYQCAVAQQTAPYASLIAANVRAARNRLGITQASCARRMRSLGFEWHQQTVGNVERGERRLNAEELLGLSVALEVTMDALLMPPFDGVYVELPGGQWIGLPAARPTPPSDTGLWDGDESTLTRHQEA
jgi:transcriptional regulator with XRE-family HTH domain